MCRKPKEEQKEETPVYEALPQIEPQNDTTQQNEQQNEATQETQTQKESEFDKSLNTEITTMDEEEVDNLKDEPIMSDNNETEQFDMLGIKSYNKK